MRRYLSVPLISLGVAVILLFVSMPLSGTDTSYWNGIPCASGKEYGFPVQFFYTMNRTSATPPQTHSTTVCPTYANISPVKVSLSNTLDDYLFWFIVSLVFVFGLIHLFPNEELKKPEAREVEQLEKPIE